MRSALHASRRHVARLVGVGVLLAVPALAQPPHAPNDQYSEFSEGDTTIRDKKTTLVWRRTPESKRSFLGATTVCAGLPGGRLPTVKELLTLVDELPHMEYDGRYVSVYIDWDAFGKEKTPVDAAYWTSTPGGTGHWVVDFSSGVSRVADDGVPAYARCIVTP